MNQLIKCLAKDESGVTAVEYGPIASLIGVASIPGASTLGGKRDTTFKGIASKMNGPSS